MQIREARSEENSELLNLKKRCPMGTALIVVRSRPLHSLGYLRLGELYRDSDRRKEARENLKNAASMFREMGMDYLLGKTREVLDRF